MVSPLYIKHHGMDEGCLSLISGYQFLRESTSLFLKRGN
jgi:hypothetical protein